MTLRSPTLAGDMDAEKTTVIALSSSTAPAAAHIPVAGPSSSRKPAKPPQARFTGGSSWAAVWNSFRKHIIPATHPSTTSESARNSSLHTDTFFDPLYASDQRQLDYLNPNAGTASRHKRGKGDKLIRITSRRPKSVGKSSQGNSRYGDEEDLAGNFEPVSHVVVDSNFDHFVPAPAKSDSGSTNKSPGMTSTPPEDASGRKGSGGGSRRNTEGDLQVEDGDHAERSELMSTTMKSSRRWALSKYDYVVVRLWRNTLHFFDSSYPEATKEHSYQKEAWFAGKSGAFVSACFYVICYVLTAVLARPLTLDKTIGYVVVAGVSSVQNGIGRSLMAGLHRSPPLSGHLRLPPSAQFHLANMAPRRFLGIRHHPSGPDALVQLFQRSQHLHTEFHECHGFRLCPTDAGHLVDAPEQGLSRFRRYRMGDCQWDHATQRATPTDIVGAEYGHL